ncbi:hypothetical protein GOBAR_AA05631 [Gossypium barbadense]|uniref:Reverse transcriptase domain-containing protein n=1 Tax=Gossypium barbadense TaxID=3634 RepID=A0A2P5YH59_GOSBA|nr:hypothetical protein GOBAR_AA05631 [Gossypium barbadense]
MEGLETQIGQLAKLISERPQDSLPSNTESNPNEQLNAISIQDEEGLVAKPRPEPVVSEGKNEAGQNEQKSVSTEYKPRVPYPNATSKDRLDEQFGKFLKLLKKLHINLPFIEALSQIPNAVKILKELLANKLKLDERSHVELNAEISSKDIHQPCSIYNKESTHEEQRLLIDELNKWLKFKPGKHEKPILCQNELNASPNQLQVGDKVLLDAADPRIATSEPNEETPLTVTSIFPYGTVEVNHLKFGSSKVNSTRLKPYVDKFIEGMRSVNSSIHRDHTPERTYGLMNLYHHQGILHSHADYPPKLQFKEFIHQSGSFTSFPIL